MKKTLAIFLVLITIMTALTGCGGNKTQTGNNTQQTENNANQVQEESNSNENSEVGGQAAENTEAKILEEIQPSEERSGKAWRYDLETDGSKIAMSVGYTTDTDYVYDLLFVSKLTKITVYMKNLRMI